MNFVLLDLFGSSYKRIKVFLRYEFTRCRAEEILVWCFLTLNREFHFNTRILHPLQTYHALYWPPKRPSFWPFTAAKASHHSFVDKALRVSRTNAIISQPEVIQIRYLTFKITNSLLFFSTFDIKLKVREVRTGYMCYFFRG